MREAVSLYNVKTKEKLMNIKMRRETHREFQIAAELKGSTMSSLLHQFIVQTIWEEKKRHPEAFAQLDADARKEPEPPTPKVIQSPARQRDKIDDWLDTARAYGGGPMPEKDRQAIREILEKREAEKSK